MEWLMAGAFAKDAADVENQTRMSRILVDEQLEGDLGIVDA